MRFNGRELSFLAAQKGRVTFDKEGVVKIREKQEGLFRKGEVYVDRYFKLCGNLLFYFRTKDPNSEPIGLFVLERYVVELDTDEGSEFSFLLVFEDDDRVVRLATDSERERDSWIEHLHIASYECMKMQLLSLREQLRARTGKDPIDDPDPSVLPDSQLDDAELKSPFLEMCLSCDGLPYNVSGREPDTFVSVHYVTPPNPRWETHAHTEVVEKSTRPFYLTTVGFNNPEKVTLSTRVKVTVYDVKERMTNTITQVGMVQFTLADLLTASDSKLRLRLNAYHSHEVGHVTIMAWQNEAHFETLNGNVTPSQPSVAFQDHQTAREESGKPKLLRDSAQRLELLRPLYDNTVTKTYRFPTNCGQELSVHEFMAESKLTYLLPKQLLRLWVEEERMRMEQLQDLGPLSVRRLEKFRAQYLSLGVQRISSYSVSARLFGMYTGAPFKPSAKKGHKEVEFAPTNLHLQRMAVQSEGCRQGTCYDTTTVGGCTAYAQRYKHGGLRRMVRQLRDQLAAEGTEESRLERVHKILGDITLLRKAVDKHSDEVCRASVQGETQDIAGAMAALADKTRQLIQVCENPLIAESVDDLASCQPSGAGCGGGGAADGRPVSEPYLTPGAASPSSRRRNRATTPEQSWKWSGTDFVKSPTQEPWELTRLNTEAALVCVVSQVEAMLEGHVVTAKWLEAISPLIIKLKRCVEVMCTRARAGLTFLSIKDSGPNVALMHSLKCRRDVVFSQAVTTLVTAFMTQLRSNVDNETYLTQLFQIGVLVEFESLLSCHGDEMGMLEDMAVGVNDLSSVVFRVIQGASTDDVMPVVKGSSMLRCGTYPDFNRFGYTIQIPVPEHMFQALPREIQRGCKIKVVPVLFNIGINEQATLAEKFGDTSLQETLNAENYHILHQYCEKFTELLGQPDGLGNTSLEQRMRLLHVSIMSKKSKNTEALHQAAEIIRKVNGIRCVNCKSGKDRTAMAVTLEQVQLLQRQHGLASHVFIQALDCMRSEGVRRENTVKNSGRRKYAFNSIQLLSIPKLYRPPSGTYGNGET